jgi:DNA/RNA-binding domain of Phe-tRNA-synthetase-like protein
VQIAAIQGAPVGVGPSLEPLLEETRETAETLSREHADRSPAAIEGLQPARELYRSFGIDPTKTRPSSESLLRRVLKAKPLPRISNAVDLSNLLALRFLLPIGLYDVGKIDGAVSMRRGLPGESYPGIRKTDVHLEGRPVLADDRGAFGNPTSDSLRTSVDAETRGILLVIFAPGSVAAEAMAAHADTAARAMRRHLASGDRPVHTTCTFLP